MKKAVTIAAAVAGYSLLETALLLCGALPDLGSWAPRPQQAYAFVAQFLWITGLVIPGQAALFSLAIHGAYKFRTRALAFALLSLGVQPALVALLIVGALVAFITAWFAEINFVLGCAVLLLSVAGLGLGLLRLVRRTQRWTVRHEAAMWLVQRQTESDRERRLRNRAIRYSLWIPSLVVLLVFLFLPEVGGLLSHMVRPRSTGLPEYRVPVPLTWVIARSGIDRGTGESAIMGLAGGNPGQTTTTLLKGVFLEPASGDEVINVPDRIPIAFWGVGTKRHRRIEDLESGRWEPKPNRKRVFAIGRTVLTCSEYRPDYPHVDRDVTYISCSSPDGLYAGFTGTETSVGRFYGMVAGIVPRE